MTRLKFILTDDPDAPIGPKGGVQTLFNWGSAPPAAVCRKLVNMDRHFGTSKLSPLHHDNRCPIHRVTNVTPSS